MYGTITKYMGTAYTGLGIAHKYDKLVASATETVFLKCPPTTALSAVLNETAMHYIKRGFDVDKFVSPIQPDITDAIFIKGPDLLFIQASHPIALEPADIGGRHRVISFYDIYDEDKLRDQNKAIVASLGEAEASLKKALHALADAKVIHDEWEAVNIKRMMWSMHEALIENLKEELFDTIILNKQSSVSHRLIGSLTSAGACDFIPSITNRIQRRMLIKALPGTGKSTIMKALGKEAERRGFDVLYGWCGLDPEGVDLVQFPELSVCIFDATKPHEYDPERDGDEIVDLLSMCEASEEAEAAVDLISKTYREKILDATGYMQAYAQAEKQARITMDSAIKDTVFQEKSKRLIGDIN
ncbi:hypothetical protein [Sporosarcina ureilytica]|uniref:Nucleotide kinase n=1 Tax=Sporosarcina ureilytica TaxID=298596 RepID=A0A1D8JJK0_9BACL|nr:hypothetical protein [Sporosarcina ureilytica]AOV08895.1 hypothetical protein BI350_15955 [Sporosarcina ureilytica]